MTSPKKQTSDWQPHSGTPEVTAPRGESHDQEYPQTSASRDFLEGVKPPRKLGVDLHGTVTNSDDPGSSGSEIPPRKVGVCLETSAVNSKAIESTKDMGNVQATRLSTFSISKKQKTPGGMTLYGVPSRAIRSCDKKSYEGPLDLGYAVNDIQPTVSNVDEVLKTESLRKSIIPIEIVSRRNVRDTVTPDRTLENEDFVEQDFPSFDHLESPFAIENRRSSVVASSRISESESPEKETSLEVVPFDRESSKSCSADSEVTVTEFEPLLEQLRIAFDSEYPFVSLAFAR